MNPFQPGDLAKVGTELGSVGSIIDAQFANFTPSGGRRRKIVERGRFAHPTVREMQTITGFPRQRAQETLLRQLRRHEERMKADA